MVLIFRRPLRGASSAWLSSGTLGWLDFVPVAYFSISAWSPTEDRGPCLSARRPMRHENLVVRLVINKRVLFTHSGGVLFLGATNKWVAYHGSGVPLTPGVFCRGPTLSP